MSVLVMPQPPADKPQRSTDGVPGWYRITYVFAQPGATALTDTIDVDETLRSGHSQVRVASDQNLQIVGTGPDIQDAIIHAGAEGRLTHATARINAANFRDVTRKGHELISRILSLLSVFSGLPIDVKFIHILEESTQGFDVSYIALGRDSLALTWDQIPNIYFNTASTELLVAFATFREGMNSFNPFYKLLSFYKVVEHCIAKGIQDGRKGRRTAPKRSIPTSMEGIDGDDIEFVRPYAGHKFEDVLTTFRDNQIRNAIAHMSPGKDLINPDDFDDTQKCRKAVPVLQFMARTMLMDRYDVETKP